VRALVSSDVDAKTGDGSPRTTTLRPWCGAVTRVCVAHDVVWTVLGDVVSPPDIVWTVVPAPRRFDGEARRGRP